MDLLSRGCRKQNADYVLSLATDDSTVVIRLSMYKGVKIDLALYSNWIWKGSVSIEMEEVAMMQTCLSTRCEMDDLTVCGALLSLLALLSRRLSRVFKLLGATPRCAGKSLGHVCECPLSEWRPIQDCNPSCRNCFGSTNALYRPRFLICECH